MLAKQGGAWHVLNQSHLNGPDALANTLRMEGWLFNDVVSALQSAGVHNPVVH